MKTIAKAIQLWVTMILTLLYMMSVDSLSLAGVLIGFITVAALIYSCTKTINKSELDTLLGNKLFS